VDEWGTYNADQIQEIIEKLQQTKEDNDKFDLVLANIYADKCKKKVDDILDVLKAGKWMTAQEALEYGFIDEIVEDAEDGKMNFAGLTNKINRMGYPSLPENFMAAPKEGLLQTVLNKVQNILDEIGKNHSNKVENQDNQNQKSMDKKEFNQVNAILKRESLAFSEEGTVINEADMALINNALQKQAEDNENLRKQNEELAEQVKNLQAAEGAESHKVDNGGEEQHDVMAEAKALYDAL
jgi:enoyl-CoA hydratase/carnithine racemase